MFMKQNQIVGIPFDSSPETEGFSDTFVPVMGVKNGHDFDYDSEKGYIYWVEYNSQSKEVSDLMNQICQAT